MVLWQRLGARLSSWQNSARYARLRAALLLVHFLVVAIVAIPAPTARVNARTWEKPTMRLELERWTRQLNRLGVETTRQELAQRITRWSGNWRAARRTLTAPLRSYLRALGTPQSWYMFTGADRVPQRFALSFRKGHGRAESIFEVGREPRHPELVSPAFLNEHRTKRVLLLASWSDQPREFEDVCRYFERLVRGHVQADEVICQLIAQPVERPDERGARRPRQLTRTLVIDRHGRERPR